jgi:hypothetical protein
MGMETFEEFLRKNGKVFKAEDGNEYTVFSIDGCEIPYKELEEYVKKTGKKLIGVRKAGNVYLFTQFFQRENEHISGRRLLSATDEIRILELLGLKEVETSCYIR